MTTYNFIMGVHLLGILIIFLELLYVSVQYPSAMQSHVLLLLIATLLMFVGYYIELKSTNLDVAFAGTVISYLGKPFILGCGLLVICDFYNKPLKKWLHYLLGALSAFISIAVITTRTTHLYYKSMTFDPTSIYEPLKLERGPLYYVYLVSIVVFFGICIHIVAREYVSNKTEEGREYASYFALMLLSGFLGYVVLLSGLSNGYDTSIFGLMGSLFFLSVLFFKYKLFDILTLAKDNALENSPTGTIIVDNHNKIVYKNVLGRELLERGLTLEIINGFKKDISQFRGNHRVYEVVKSTVAIHGRQANTSYEFTDITDSANYQKRLEHDVNERTARIESIQREVIGSLASVVEARSLETGQHIARTKDYVEMIARQLKETDKYKNVITENYISLLVNAAPLHDIGKISISDTILNKPGKLTPEEFKEMKKHVKYGAEVIEKTMRGVEKDEYVEMAIDVALYHHEWWNGKGYSKKLKGEQIPLSARIMAVADTYDALINKRIYKPPFTKKHALEVINEESGTHFDPEIANAFITVMSK